MRKIDSDITTVFVYSHGTQMKLAAGRLYFFPPLFANCRHVTRSPWVPDVTQKLEIEHHFAGLDERKWNTVTLWEFEIGKKWKYAKLLKFNVKHWNSFWEKFVHRVGLIRLIWAKLYGNLKYRRVLLTGYISWHRLHNCPFEMQVRFGTANENW